MGRGVTTYAGFLLFAIAILFCISPDSYTHDLFERGDSAWYFLCGKAWMNGMVPYVDFSDSKGPLLWLIYGAGYLVHHYSYVGVFWISCLFYSLTFFYTYKTARLFLADHRLSVFCAAAMALSFFNPLLHHEVRCEDYCQLFFALSLYHTCRLQGG